MNQSLVTSENILVKIKYYMIANTVLEAKDPARHNWSLAFKTYCQNILIKYGMNVIP
jgi:hypothetical protein